MTNPIAAPVFRWNILLDSRKQTSYALKRQKQYLIKHLECEKEEWKNDRKQESLGGAGIDCLGAEQAGGGSAAFVQDGRLF
jgi:hypothetical protein